MTLLSKGFVCSLTYSFLYMCHFCSSGRYSELHAQYNEAVNTVKEQKELITQLETDLLSVNALPSAFRGQGEVRKVVKMLVMFNSPFLNSPYKGDSLSGSLTMRIRNVSQD